MDAENLFGRRLHELRTGARLSQKELAIAAGIVPANISRWESGLREPLASQVQKIAAALGVDVGELFRVAKPMKTPAKPARKPKGTK